MNKIIELPSPNLDPSQQIGFNTGQRPMRKNGIRIEVESIGNKTIVHNYGHGRWGVSLFFGSCKQALEKYQNHCLNKKKKLNRISVIGGG